MGFASNVAKFLLGGQKVPVCRECADKFKKRQEKRDRKRIADGLCTRCFVNPVESGKTNCEVCIQKAVEFNRQQRREAKIAVIGHLGGKCTGEGCQESDIRVLTLHHPDKMEQNTVENLEAEAEPACTSN